MDSEFSMDSALSEIQLIAICCNKGFHAHAGGFVTGMDKAWLP